MTNFRILAGAAGLFLGAAIVFYSLQNPASATVDGFEISGVAGQINGASYPGVWIVTKSGKVRWCQVASSGIDQPKCTPWSE